nr:hypothetical protein GCM10020093_054100 [Planobispora longispora]
MHRRLGVALEAIERCGAEVPAGLAARRRSLETYVSHAVQPDGRLVPIGDSPAGMRPAGFAHEEATVGVFDGGYVFGRTAWDDPGAAHYSIRFGPGRRLHGHEDHLGVTYHAQGRDILVEAGFHSYERTPYRKWTSSPRRTTSPSWWARTSGRVRRRAWWARPSPRPGSPSGSPTTPTGSAASVRCWSTTAPT